MRSRLLPSSLLCLLLSALTGCLFEDDDKVAGGAEDFPNTLAALGGSTAGNIAAHGEWDQFASMPQLDVAQADSLVVGPGEVGLPTAKAGASPAAKGSATIAAAVTAAETVLDLSDTATLGVGRIYFRDEGLLRVRTDTVVFLWDDKARDSVRGNETLLEKRGSELLKARFNLKAYRFENLDSTGGFDRAVFHEADLKAATGAVHHKALVVMPGPDGDFSARADNQPVYYATARTLAGDTLDILEVTDADGDGRLWGAGDSGLVDARYRLTEPALRPTVAQVTQRLKAMLFKEAGRSYPVAFSETRLDKDGRKVGFSVRGFRGGADSTFGPGDTVVVTVRTTPPPNSQARFLERIARYRIRLAEEPGRFAGNTLLHFTMETTWREG
ncbi:MAG TPA: hypothetical protein VK465_06050, partial [Fibrobacteria bacterium]|nr:hypothetical protein [Fibrobacteria bacterium]